MITVRALLALCVLLSLACGEVTEPGPAEAFCADYRNTCGFDNDLGGDSYLDEGDCVTRFDRFGEVQSECVLEHLAFAVGGDEANACPSAEGAAPCDRESSYCAQYSLTCGFDNDFGGDPHADREDCQARYDGLSPERQTCVLQHLDFARAAEPHIHCPHAEGEAPCD